MKRLILIICALVVSTAASHAQTDKKSVEARDIEFIRTGEYVTVTFTLDVGKRVSRSAYDLVVNPIIRGGVNERELPSIIVQGRRAKVSAERHKLATGQRIHQQEPVYTKRGGSLNYGVTIPYESWMRGSQLIFNGVSVGCCSSTEVAIGLIADNILHYEPQTDIQIIETPIVVQKVSTGDRLAVQHPFIATVAALKEAVGGVFDYNMPLNMGKALTAPKQDELERFINNTREGSISIYFRQGNGMIDRNFSGNNKNLVELISTVRALVSAHDSKIAKVIIVGFASPEGTIAINDRIAWDRAVSVKSFLMANSDIQPELINIYNGSVDWSGLCELVSGSDMYRKERIIDIIDNMPIWDSQRQRGRHGELMRLDSGTTYRYMLREFFPKLRQAAYIKVYYEDK